MGNGSAIVVLGAILAAGVLFWTGQRRGIETQQAQGEHQMQVLTRQTSKSGFDRMVSSIERDLMNAQPAYSGITVGDTRYSGAVTENLYGDVDVVTTGEYHDYEHEMSGNLIFALEHPAAMVVSADTVVVSGSGSSYMISGEDHRMPSRSYDKGYLAAGKAVVTNSTGNLAALNNLATSSLVGSNGTGVSTGSAGIGADVALAESIYQSALVNASKTVLTAPFNGSYGTPGEPAIVHVLGDFEASTAFSGHGLLIVDSGDFVVSTDEFSWEGLIIVRTAEGGTADVSLQGGTVHGAIMAYEDSAIGGSSCYVPFAIDDLATVPQVAVNVRIDVLGAAISAGGAYDMPVTTMLHLGSLVETPWGSYDSPTAGNVNTNSTYLYEPAASFDVGTEFRISARSWSRDDDEDGSEDDDWSVSMEHSSSSDDDQLLVLRDGDDVPDLEGYLDQESAASFVSDFIGDDGKIELGDNQTIYLFELGTTDTESSAYDMQDLVALMTFAPAGVAGCTTDPVLPGQINLSMGGNANVRYSAEALGKLGKHFGSVENRLRVVVTTTSSVTPLGDS